LGPLTAPTSRTDGRSEPAIIFEVRRAGRSKATVVGVGLQCCPGRAMSCTGIRGFGIGGKPSKPLRHPASGALGPHQFADRKAGRALLFATNPEQATWAAEEGKGRREE